MKKSNWKLVLIIVAGILAVVMTGVFGVQSSQNKAFSLEEQVNTADSDIKVQEKIGVKIAETKKNVYEETVNTVLALVLTLPLEVLMDHYWPKSYRERLPGFVDKVLEYYGRWEDGELDMDKLKEDLWEYGGIRLEPAQIDMEDISKNNEK